MLFFQQIAPYLLLWLSVALFRVELRWPVANFIFSLYSKFVDMKVNLTYIRLLPIYFRQQGYRNNFRFPFSSLLTLLLSLLHKTRAAMRFPSKITSNCIWVAIPVGWVSLHWYACGADGRSVGRTVTWLSKFLEWVDHQIFLPMVLRFGHCARVDLCYDANVTQVFPWRLLIWKK